MLTPASSLEAEIAKGTKHLVLGSGVYYMEKPAVLDARASGLTIEAAPGQTVILNGGRKLALDWKPSTRGTPGIFEATVPADIKEIDSLWIDGRLQHLARFPNFDPNARYLGGGSAEALSPQRAMRWKHPAGAWVHGLHLNDWGGVHDRIESVSPDGAVKLEGGWGNNRGTRVHARERFVEGIFEELDAPGEWFFDAEAHTLFVILGKGVELSKATVTVSRTESLIELRGTKEAPVTNITLRGLTFTGTARTFMKTREPLLRSDWMIYRGGVVFLNRTQNVRIENCDFQSVGGNGVFFSGANTKGIVNGCHFADSGAGGVCFAGEPKAVRNPLSHYNERLKLSQIDLTPGPLTDDYPMECEVSDCLMENLGLVEKQTSGVTIHMSRRIAVKHCTMHHLPRAAINIGDGCWGGHVIDGCDLFDTVRESGDHGSFNSWGRDRWWELNLEGKPWRDELAKLDAMETTVLRNSRWLCEHGWDIDLDDGSSNYLIENNLCLDGGLKLREGYFRVVRNNLIVKNGFHFHVWPVNNRDTVTGNLTTGGYTGNVQLPAGWGAGCDYNFVHHTGEPVGPAVKMQQVSGFDKHSIQGDAKFKDAAHSDWTLATDSPALTIGYKPFPLDSFGVQNGRLKPAAQAAFAAFTATSKQAAAGPRDETVRDFMGGKVKNLTGEKSRLGLYSSSGVLVVEAPAGSALQIAHAIPGDVILAWDKDPVPDWTSLAKLSAVTASPTIITVWRDFAKLMLWR
jgi:hypothetical protein